MIYSLRRQHFFPSSQSYRIRINEKRTENGKDTRAWNEQRKKNSEGKKRHFSYAISISRKNTCFCFALICDSVMVPNTRHHGRCMSEIENLLCNIWSWPANALFHCSRVWIEELRLFWLCQISIRSTRTTENPTGFCTGIFPLSIRTYFSVHENIHFEFILPLKMNARIFQIQSWT